MTPRGLFLSSAHTSPAHLAVIGGNFVFKSVLWYTALVCYSEFGGCPLFGSIKCTASMGIEVGTSTVVRGGPLLGGSIIGGSTVNGGSDLGLNTESSTARQGTRSRAMVFAE